MAEVVNVRDNQNGVQPSKPVARRTLTPPVDVYENAEEVFVVADVPGAGRDQIDVRVEHDTLTIETTRAALPNEASPAIVREYVAGDYIRSFRIPAGIDAAAVRAELKNGTLVVRLPKAAAAKPRKVPVVAS